MSYGFANRVKETTVSTGTGAINLAGAVAGFQGFVTAGLDTKLVRYAIVAVDGDDVPTGDWEVGIGVVADAAPDTLSRVNVEDSSNSGALVNFTAGTKSVLLVDSARETAQTRVHVQLAANFAIANNLSTIIDFVGSDHEIFDADEFHEGVTNPERLTVPTGFDGRYLVIGTIRWASNATGRREVTVRHKNSGGTTLYSKQVVAAAVNGDDTRQTSAWVFDAVAGDFFEMFALQTSGGSLDASGGAVIQDHTSLAAWRVGA